MANQWDEIYKKQGRSYKRYDILSPHEDLPRVARFFRKHGVKCVLDLGCGAGRNLIYLSRFFETYGLDAAPEGLRLAKAELKKSGLNAGLVCANAFSGLPYRDAQFEAVVSVQVLQHGTESQIIRAITEIVRVLKPSGLIFVTLSGRYSRGRLRPVLVKTARKIAPNTYVPRVGAEAGLTHFVYNKKLILKHYRAFNILSVWRDAHDYYCFLAKLK